MIGKETPMTNLLENCKRLDYSPDQPRDELGRFGETADGAHALSADLMAVGGLTSANVSTFEVVKGNDVVKHYRVHAFLKDPKSGASVLRKLTGPADAKAVVADMHKEMKEQVRDVKERAKATRSRIAAERSTNRS
jgi:hypothetical protein